MVDYELGYINWVGSGVIFRWSPRHVRLLTQLSIHFLTLVTASDMFEISYENSELTDSFLSWMTQLKVSIELGDLKAI